jgi:branched-chain amino acid transport system permease protein
MNYFLHLVIYLDIYVITALSLNLVTGYLGRLSLAHAGFVAVGAYGYALATKTLGLGFVSALVLGSLVAAVGSLALSLPAMRFKGDFFVIITLAVQAFLYAIAYNWFSADAEIGTLRNLTNGPFGIAGISKPVIGGIRIDTLRGMSLLSTVVMALCAAIVIRVTRSPWGRLLQCMRDDELALRSLGKRVRTLKIQAFAVACALAAVAGGLYAAYISYIDPSAASLDESILLVCMLYVGGSGNLRGPVVGALVLLLLPELLRLTPMPTAAAANIRLLVYGLLVLIMVHVRPQGLAGAYRME